MNDKGACQTASATPGLLTRQGSQVGSPVGSPGKETGVICEQINVEIFKTNNLSYI